MSTTKRGQKPRIEPSQVYDMTVRSWFVTGSEVDRWIDDMPEQATVAFDIETAGVANPFDMRCVTAAWDIPASGGWPEASVCVLLDPRVDAEADAIRRITDKAAVLVAHNAMYDVAPMYVHGLISEESIFTIWDTLVLARMRFTSDLGGRDLHTLTRRYLPGLVDDGADMRKVFAAAGYTSAEGWEKMDITAPAYRRGAMLDTLATLKVAPAIYTDLVEHYLSHERREVPGSDTDEAVISNVHRLIEREQITARVMLARSAKGLAIDEDYLADYEATVAADVAQAEESLRSIGLDPESGTTSADVVEWLNDRGELPQDWPRTATGKLSAAKAHFESLDHPLVSQVTALRYARRVMGYLEKVKAIAEATGRLHPRAHVLGASATGRMSYSDPEIQQFPDEARPIIVPDPGRKWVSIDWSSIEPVIIANATGDTGFLSAFDRGEDLYVPLGRAIGLIGDDVDDEAALRHPGRKKLKTVMLATMYGQGVRSTAERMGVDVDEVADLRDRIFDQLPNTQAKLDQLREVGTRAGVVRTIDGRWLSVEPDADNPGRYRGYKAMNYFVQGSAYSLLSEVIVELHRRGLSWGVMFAMHDELVVDSEIAGEVRTIMETAPLWLAEASGGSAKLKTDANDLFVVDDEGNITENHWKSV